MKFLKHLFSTLVILSVFFETEKTFSFSEEFIPTPELYNELIAEEILSKDITSNDWLEIIEISKKLEEGFSNNEDFEELILTPFSSGFGGSGGSGLLVKGDILITNGTNLSGLYGHTGIVVGSNQILHIEGPKHRPSIITLSLWHSKYTNRSSSSETIVYRHSKTTIRNRAGDWTKAMYGPKGKYQNTSYSIITNLKSFDKTYCSKIVWQTYTYGPKPSYLSQTNGRSYGIVYPYDLKNTIFSINKYHEYRSY